jgi:hypothetical protein
MRSARGDLRDHIVLSKNDHGPSYRALAGIAAAESSKHRLLRDSQRRLIFDFCNMG